MAERIETLIIGAGVIGSSVAMHLAAQGMADVRVVDLDLEGTLSSSELNAGGVRATWTQPVNIEMSQVTIGYFGTIAEQVGYRPCGYLWLYGAEKLKAALQARERQLKMGWPVEAWDLTLLKRKVPFLDKTQGVDGVIFSPKDGLVNPNRVKNHFREQAKKAGVRFEDRLFLRQARYQKNAAYPIRLLWDRISGSLSEDAKVEIYSGREISLEAEIVEYEAQRVVNCAGAWAGKVAKILGYSSPAYPVRRQVCIFDCKEVDLTPYGMMVDTSGVYFHPEATHGLAGFANHEEPRGINYKYDGDAFFMEVIWPALYERSTAFEKLRHIAGWAGQYEVSPDESAILGKVENGEAGHSGRVFEAHSFSGHGVMHSYAAGRALAELMAHGRFQTLDSSMLAGSRFETGRLIRETLVI